MQKRSSEKDRMKKEQELLYISLNPAYLDPFPVQDKIITVKHRATGNFVFLYCIRCLFNTKSCVLEFVIKSIHLLADRVWAWKVFWRCRDSNPATICATSPLTRTRTRTLYRRPVLAGLPAYTLFSSLSNNAISTNIHKEFHVLVFKLHIFIFS